MAIETSAEGATTIGPDMATEAHVAARATKVSRTIFIVCMIASVGAVLEAGEKIAVK